jgi:hypothetical protein
VSRGARSTATASLGLDPMSLVLHLSHVFAAFYFSAVPFAVGHPPSGGFRFGNLPFFGRTSRGYDRRFLRGGHFIWDAIRNACSNFRCHCADVHSPFPPFTRLQQDQPPHMPDSLEAQPLRRDLSLRGRSLPDLHHQVVRQHHDRDFLPHHRRRLPPDRVRLPRRLEVADVRLDFSPTRVQRRPLLTRD